ncbi:MAG: DUF488 domain-containing protein [Chloroflexi bacterium]|nr:DUF488 domain-containing protein [Chloroflexota bacterium]MDL1885831.1 DUF488 domain-containing protein [Anaerolineae bacterium CFX8]
MYHRRKILLALVEVFGGKLTAMECHKLMFLLCQRTRQNHYDFFPYKFGAYSFILHQDKLRLTDLGYLQIDDSFKITGIQRFLPKLDIFTQTELFALRDAIGTLHGRSLLHKVYLEYPYYATRSEIASEILTPSERESIAQYRNLDSSPCLFTIGYEGLTIDSYLSILISNNISALVDVRKNPISKKYGFSKSQLKRYAESAKIEYIHLPELGVPSNMRQNLNSEQAYIDLFNQYLQQILSNQSSSLRYLKDLVYDKRRVAITCFEASHTHCHRSKITEYFENDSSFEIPIVHLS